MKAAMPVNVRTAAGLKGPEGGGRRAIRRSRSERCSSANVEGDQGHMLLLASGRQWSLLTSARRYAPSAATTGCGDLEAV